MANWLRSLLARIVTNLSMVLTLMGLAGLAYVGHRYDWKMPAFSSLWGEGDKTEEDTKPEEEPPLPVDLTPPRPPDPKPPPEKTIKLALGTAARAGFHLAPVQQRTMSQQVRAYGVLDYDQELYAHLATRAPGMTWSVLKKLGDRVSRGDVLAVIESTDVGKAKAEFLQSLVQSNVRKVILDQLKGSSGSVSPRSILEAETALREARIKLLTDQQTLVNLGLPVRSEDLAGLTDDQMVRQVRLLGLPADLLRGHDPETLTANLLPLKAPWDGEVISRNIVVGEIATSSVPQFTLADVRQLWVMLDVRGEEAAQLALKQEVVFVPDGARDEKPEKPAPSSPGLAMLGGGLMPTVLGLRAENGSSAVGKIDWISPEVDEKTRTVRVRAVVPNPLRRLRPHTFGTGRITVRSHPDTLVVPSDAIQTDGPFQMVFVWIDDQTFESRLVQTGMKDDEYTEIVSGVSLGEKVVTTGSFILKTELFKDRLGGGDD